MVVGIIFTYGPSSTEPEQFYLAEQVNNCSNLSERTFEVGQTIQLNTMEDSFACSVEGKVFRDNRGNFIRQTVCFVGGGEVGFRQGYVGRERG